MDETGVFVTLCQHMIIQFIMDMVQCGERAKFPLTTAEKLMNVFSSNQLYLYDVGCTFLATIKRSSLADTAKTLNFKSCTGAFHGAAHNCPCQLDFLIGMIEGAGLEDGEGNEQIFSASNSLAMVTHHATAYYHHMQIHIHFEKWDEEKYENLGIYVQSSVELAG
ncbi:hypothetical protein BS47DRAFT_1303306 [Hydnum rufescens UP504]|uniref:Uncharacterized protein n=1 Tax=Hydnum rufescens UP504 TaxID=1448309 RepID=A0A9P6ALI7_9AGAM|nr:hypothetical protein BS47DRAFT_1303306 [Hydnum rufescens UP504]